MRSMLAVLAALALAGGCAEIPQPKRAAVRQSAQVLTPSPQARQCLASLGTTRASFAPVPDRYFGAGCAMLNTVRLSALQGDSAQFALSNLGPVSCPLAETFAAWARFGVDRAARQILGSPLVRIETMGSFACRNIAGTARRSAHARAEAIDVAGFELADGRRISVAADWSAGAPQTRAFLRVVHASACKRFGTVLGPAYNEAHRDHIHVELGEAGTPAFCR